MEKKTQSAEFVDKYQDRTTGIIAYLTIIGLIAAIVMNKEKKDELASFHIRLSLVLYVTGIALTTIGLIPKIGLLISIFGTPFIVIPWLLGSMNAQPDEMRLKIPVEMTGKFSLNTKLFRLLSLTAYCV